MSRTHRISAARHAIVALLMLALALVFAGGCENGEAIAGERRASEPAAKAEAPAPAPRVTERAAIKEGRALGKLDKLFGSSPLGGVRVD